MNRAGAAALAAAVVFGACLGALGVLAWRGGRPPEPMPPSVAPPPVIAPPPAWQAGPELAAEAPAPAPKRPVPAPVRPAQPPAEPPAQAVAGPAPPGWVAAPARLVGSDGWDAEARRLVCRGGAAVLSLLGPDLPGDCRIRVDASTADTEWLTIYTQARGDPGYANEQFHGLQAKFGSSGPRHAAALKSAVQGYLAEGAVVDLSGRHELVLERIGTRLRMLVDGREVLAADLPPGRHGYGSAVGIGIWDGDVIVHDATVWRAGAAVPAATPAAASPARAAPATGTADEF